MDPALEERLKAALWFAIGKMVDNESLELECNAAPQFIAALTEMTWNQIRSVAVDLESFAQHAGRSTITTDDVLLITRRNDELYDIMKSYIDGLQAKKARAKAKPRGMK